MFDGSCTSNCSANMVADTAVGGIGLYSGYTATVSMNGHNVTNYTNFYIGAGTFSAGSGTLNLYTFVSTGGTFNAGTSTAIMVDTWIPAGFDLTTPVTFNNLTLGLNGGNLIILNGTANVTGNLVIGAYVVYGTGSVVMNGSGAQTFSDAGNGGTNFQLPLEVNQSSGSFTITSNLYSSSSFTLVSGTVSISSGKNVILGDLVLDSGTTFTSTNATLTFGGVFESTSTFVSGSTFNANGGTVVVADNISTINFNNTPGFNNLTLGENIENGVVVNGTANVSGNFAVNSPGPYGFSGSATFVMDGTGAQTISDTLNGSSEPRFPIIVNKSSGSVAITSTFFSHNPLTVESGTVSIPSGYNVGFGALNLDSGTTFTSTTGTLTLSGFVQTSTFQSGATFNANGGTLTIADLATTLDLASAFTFNNLGLGNGSGSGDAALDGTANVVGNLTIDVWPADGTGAVVMDGSGAQTISDLNPGSNIMDIPITVNKSGGSVSLGSYIPMWGASFTVAAGTVNLGSNVLYVDTFTVNSGATFNCDGNCGVGTACGQGANDLQCSSFSNSGTINP